MKRENTEYCISQSQWWQPKSTKRPSAQKKALYGCECRGRRLAVSRALRTERCDGSRTTGKECPDRHVQSKMHSHVDTGQSFLWPSKNIQNSSPHDRFRSLRNSHAPQAWSGRTVAVLVGKVVSPSKLNFVWTILSLISPFSFRN